MNGNLIVYPMLVMVVLTLLIYVRLINVKVRELKAGKVDMPRPRLHEDAWPESVLLQINNSIRNQFELPVLFYVVCFVFVGIGRGGGTLALVAAWLFVASRIAHAWGSSHVEHTSRTGGGCSPPGGGSCCSWCCWQRGSSSAAP
jgi:hypothetical protein